MTRPEAFQRGDTISRFPTRSNICLLKPAAARITALARSCGGGRRRTWRGPYVRARSQIRQQYRPADRVESGRERWLVKGSQLRRGGGDCVVRVPMAAVIEERDFDRRDC